MLPATLSWLFLVCVTVCICQTSGRYDEETGDSWDEESGADKRSMDTRLAVEKRYPWDRTWCTHDAGAMFCRTGSICHCTGEASRDDRCTVDSGTGSLGSQMCCKEISACSSENIRFKCLFGDEQYVYVFGKCVKFYAVAEMGSESTSIGSWERANRECHERSGGLITPKTADEHAFVVEEIRSKALEYDNAYTRDSQIIHAFIGLIYDSSTIREEDNGQEPSMLLGWRYTEGLYKTKYGEFLLNEYRHTSWAGDWRLTGTNNGPPAQDEEWTMGTVLTARREDSDTVNGSWWSTVHLRQAIDDTNVVMILGCERPPTPPAIIIYA